MPVIKNMYKGADAQNIWTGIVVNSSSDKYNINAMVDPSSSPNILVGAVAIWESTTTETYKHSDFIVYFKNRVSQYNSNTEVSVVYEIERK